MADFTAKVRRRYFHSAAHFVEAGAHAGADAVGQGVFANRDALQKKEIRQIPKLPGGNVIIDGKKLLQQLGVLRVVQQQQEQGKDQ